MATSCSMAMGALNSGAATLGSFTTVIFKYENGDTRLFAGYTGLPDGLNVTFTNSQAGIAAAGFSGNTLDEALRSSLASMIVFNGTPIDRVAGASYFADSQKSDCGNFVDNPVSRIHTFGMSKEDIGIGMAAWAQHNLHPKSQKGTLGFGGFKQEYTNGGQNGVVSPCRRRCRCYPLG